MSGVEGEVGEVRDRDEAKVLDAKVAKSSGHGEAWGLPAGAP